MIIEAALVLPLLMVFVAGIIDFGVGFRDRTIIQAALRNGARAGAAAVANPTADRLVLSTLQAGLIGATRLTVQKAIVYEATGATGEPSATCQGIAPQVTGAGSLSGNCNVYSGSQVTNSGTTFTGATTYTSGTTLSSTCSNGWNRYWCAGGVDAANERTANLSGVVDSLGLWVQIGYEPFTGVFGTTDLIITDWVVMRLEPPPG